ncbi:kinase-like domain-containing protein [Staphylotrichum tortipilum]|uniref:Kinase-like domain-containing protein n=1 Tax=Staphylotrichum tortipilum TaxID=2831512 RepID=A0AAN6MEN6_9PEZI|nr:kinase-like domain-containing protein [Staphylotrichum longicolle]
MSTIQQLKNFIRHGKQARAVDEPARKHDTASSPKQQQHQQPQHQQQSPHQPAKHGMPAPVTEPIVITGPAAPGEPTHPSSMDPSAKQPHKRIPDENIAKLVAEENESKSKFPAYPGLERWELLEKMGDGAFSNVYRARDREGHKGEVAIKVVRKFEMNKMQRANILKEVQIMRQIDHPNIIKLIDFSESRQYYYIILDLAPGGELFHQIVRLTYFSEDLSRHVITQVAKALEYLHVERGVVHRDIKPENILFNPIPFIPFKNPKPKQPGDEDKVDEGEFVKGVGAGGIGQIKIADFGLSKIVWENQTMTPCGTVGYTAPEIVKDERYSKSVDMWAMGCVLYTLLCGFPPFYDESIEMLTEKVAKGQYTFLSPWWDEISDSAKDLISHLLCVDPEKRFTIQEFLAHPWIRESGPTPREERKPTASTASEQVVHAFEMARLVEGERRCDFRSPAAVNLREVFDVGYAVHRQEEEGKLRKQLGAKVAGGTQQLSGVDEDEEMTDDNSGEADSDGDKPATGSTQQLERSMRDAQIRDQEQRGRDRERRAHPPPAAVGTAGTEPRGYGQHSAVVAAAARQQVRERNRQKPLFELNLDGATLLGRRGVKPAARVA